MKERRQPFACVGFPPAARHGQSSRFEGEMPLEAQTRQRPMSVTIAILVYSIEVAVVVVSAIGYLIEAGLRLDDLRGTYAAATASPKSAAELQIAFMLLLVAIVGLVSIYGLRRLQPWAWRLAIGFHASGNVHYTVARSMAARAPTVKCRTAAE